VRVLAFYAFQMRALLNSEESKLYLIKLLYLHSVGGGGGGHKERRRLMCANCTQLERSNFSTLLVGKSQRKLI
jgi:hypothetical protein